MPKTREDTFDIMKGVGILLMIIGHFEFLPTTLHTWIFSFHMPLFFLISGYFFKSVSEPIVIWQKNIHRLLLPFIVTAVFIVLLSLLSSIKNHDSSLFENQAKALVFPTGIYPDWMSRYFGWTGGIGPIWFLIALFWCRVFTYYLLRVRFPLWGVMLVGVAAAFLDHFIINLPFALLHGASAMSFFIVGYWISKHGLKWIPVTICLICWIIAVLFSQMDMYRCDYSIYPLDFAGACGGSLCVYFISRFLSRQHHSILCGLAHLLAWIGRASLAILCIHAILSIFSPVRALHFTHIWYVGATFNLIAPILAAWLCSKLAPARKFFGIA